MRFARTGLSLGLLLLLAGCLYPTGDLGRVRPSVLHDEVGPALASTTGFNQTDEEAEMHERIWRFRTSPHAKDWAYDFPGGWRRTGWGTDGQTDRYYRWLTGSRYESSRVRFLTVADHAQADLDTVPGVFAAICAVREIDRRRAVADEGLALSDARLSARRTDRQDKNETAIAEFTVSLRYRYESYDLALTRLLVETPHEEAREADAALGELALWVDRADRGEFCAGSRQRAGEGGEALPGRVLLGEGRTEPIRK